MTPGVDTMTRESALEDRFLADRDGLAPPALITRLGDVLTRHFRAGALAVAGREEHVIPRREMRGVLLPGLPLVARRAAREQKQRAKSEQESEVSRAHRGLPPAAVVHCSGAASEYPRRVALSTVVDFKQSTRRSRSRHE